MIRKAVRRAAVWTAGAGLIVAPMSVATSPQFTLAACNNPGPNYPQGIATQTTLTLDDSVGRYGDTNVARAQVTSNQGNPNRGVVRFFINSKQYAQRTVNNGNASIQLPRGLNAGKTHKVRAKFISRCPYNNSQSGIRYYTVERANVTTNPEVRNGRKARFAATVRRVGEGDGFNPQGGKVRFTVRRQSSGNEVRSGTANVRNGFASIDLRNLDNGNYTITATYLGSSNFRQGSSTENFSVG